MHRPPNTEEESAEPVRAHSLSAAASDEGPTDYGSTPSQGAPESAPREVPEWSKLVRGKASGAVNGKKYFIAPDGGVYVDRSESIPIRFGHGGKHVFTSKESGLSETRYWNAEKAEFTEEDPTPEIRRKPKENQERKKSSDYDAGGLRHSQDDLRQRVEAKDMSDELRAEFERGIQTMKTRADRRALMELLKALPVRGAPLQDQAIEKKGTPEKIAGARSGLRDSYREDAFDTQGHDHEELEELKARLARRNGRKYDPKIDVPKLVTPEDDRTRVRKGLLAQLDPAGFTIAELHSDNYTGGPEQGTENKYSHPEAPGHMFTESEVEARRRQPEAPPVPPAGGGDGSEGGGPGGGGGDRGDGNGQGAGGDGPGEPTAGQVIEVTEVIQTPNWSTQRPEFKGVKAKSLHELLHGTTHDQHHFAILVESIYPGADAVMRKSLTGERLTTEEGRMLEYARHEYARRMGQVDFVRTYLKPSDLEIAARRDPEFARVLGLNGSKRTAEVFKREIAEISMQRTDLLNRLYNACTSLKHHRESKHYKAWDKDVHALAREAGTDAASFDLAFDMRTAETRRASRAALRDRYHKARGPFMRIVDRLVPLSDIRAGRMMRKAAKLNSKVVRSYLSPQSRDVSAVNNELGVLTEMLRFTVSDKLDVVEMLEREGLQNIRASQLSESGPTTVGAAMTEGERAPQSVDDEIGTHVRNFRTADRRDWDHATRTERRASMNGLQEAVARRQNAGGQGWFARACAALFRALFNTKAEEAINRRPATA